MVLEEAHHILSMAYKGKVCSSPFAAFNLYCFEKGFHLLLGERESYSVAKDSNP